MVKTSLEFGQALEQEVSQRIADLIPKLVASITGGPNQIIKRHAKFLLSWYLREKKTSASICWW